MDEEECLAEVELVVDIDFEIEVVLEIDACEFKPRSAVAEEFPFVDERLVLCKVVLAFEVEFAVRVETEEVMLALELDFCELEPLIAPPEEEEEDDDEVLLVEDIRVVKRLLVEIEVEPAVCCVTELVLTFELDDIELDSFPLAEEGLLAGEIGFTCNSTCNSRNRGYCATRH